MPSLYAAIKQKHTEILSRIAQAAQTAGRDPAEIKLVVVTKGQPVEVIQAAIEAGIQRLGENYPEEALEKMFELNGSDLEWHMIGHLQSRKVKIVSEHFHWLHSLDSLRLAEKLNRSLEMSGRRLPVLLEMNVGGEGSKYGWPAQDPQEWQQLVQEVEAIQALPYLRVCGLMAMPPLGQAPEDSRVYFRKLVALKNYLNKTIPGLELSELSMGTSFDFEQAILEGATFIRVGEAILGPRPPKKEIHENND